jgi:uncharacterized membrane protein YvbJ
LSLEAHASVLIESIKTNAGINNILQLVLMVLLLSIAVIFLIFAILRKQTNYENPTSIEKRLINKSSKDQFTRIIEKLADRKDILSAEIQITLDL